MALYKTSLLISVPEVVGYKTSLFKIFTSKWLLIRPYGDFVQGLITSPLVVKKLSFLKAVEEVLGEGRLSERLHYHQ